MNGVFNAETLRKSIPSSYISVRKHLFKNDSMESSIEYRHLLQFLITSKTYIVLFLYISE